LEEGKTSQTWRASQRLFTKNNDLLPRAARPTFSKRLARERRRAEVGGGAPRRGGGEKKKGRRLIRRGEAPIRSKVFERARAIFAGGDEIRYLPPIKGRHAAEKKKLSLVGRGEGGKRRKMRKGPSGVGCVLSRTPKDAPSSVVCSREKSARGGKKKNDCPLKKGPSRSK